MAEEATINPDGTQDMPPVEDPTADAGGEEIPIIDEETQEKIEEVIKGVDPAIYLIVVAVIVLGTMFYLATRKKDGDDFFDDLDGDKFNLKLPAAVDEYYAIKDKCMAAGWTPGQPPTQQQQQAPNGPHRVLAQALMKRCIADIPIVTHIQKESAGMNKLYAQSMCSVKQWRSYQAAEGLVSGEVDEVRAEADEIEPGWSQVIWRQAMQYHGMLKQKHEQEQAATAEAAQKRKEIEGKVNAEKRKLTDAQEKELAAEKAAAELLKMEEREKSSKKAFSADGMKKGFLNAGKKK